MAEGGGGSGDVAGDEAAASSGDGSDGVAGGSAAGLESAWPWGPDGACGLVVVSSPDAVVAVVSVGGAGGGSAGGVTSGALTCGAGALSGATWVGAAATGSPGDRRILAPLSRAGSR